MGLKTKIVPLKLNLEPIGFKMMMSTIRVKFVKTMEGKRINYFFLIVFLAYLLVGSPKFQIWGLVGYGI